MLRANTPRIAVIGAGIAGAACARALTLAGCAVQVVDKSRGPGGRLATKRLEWLDRQGSLRTARLDHGAPAFAASSAAFRDFLASALPADALASWQPTMAPGSRALDAAGPMYLPTPDMPSLCRWLLRDTPVIASFTVDRLTNGPSGWQLEAAGSPLPGFFDAVVLALPPAQAAPLLAPHRRDWAQHASLALMQPCWTLLGVARSPDQPVHWDLGRPAQGPLAWVMRNDARAGRESTAGEVHWVVHARAGWSRQHLEQAADGVQAHLQAALQDWLGEPVDWQHAVVHRWRYAVPQSPGGHRESPCWWDAARGLGVCGDFLGGTGVEGAWVSAQGLVGAILRGGSGASPAPDGLTSDRSLHRSAA